MIIRSFEDNNSNINNINYNEEEQAAVKIQSLGRGYLSRKNEARIETKVLSHNRQNKPVACITKFTGKLGYVTGFDADMKVKTAFTVASVKKEHARTKVMSNGTNLFMPQDIKKNHSDANPFVMINGGFFEMLKPKSKNKDGRCYGVKAGTPIGPTKTISDTKENGYNNFEKLQEDKQNAKSFSVEKGKSYDLNQGTLVPIPYEKEFATMKIAPDGITQLVPYEELKSLSDTNIKNENQNIESCVSGAPLLIKNGKIQILETQIKEERYQFPEDGICGPGQLVHGSTQNPRSAIGYNDKEIKILYAVGTNHERGDKIPGVKGLTFSELARVTDKVGMQEAMNLDGGGSCFIGFKTDKDEKQFAFQNSREMSNYIKIEIT